MSNKRINVTAPLLPSLKQLNSFEYLKTELLAEGIIDYKKVIGSYYFSLLFYYLLEKNTQEIFSLCKKIRASKMLNRTFF